MKQKEIETGNKLIAEFMGGKLYKSESHNHSFHTAPKKMPTEPVYSLVIGNLKYNSSWDWLMPVVEKIGRIRHDNPYPKDLKKGEVIIDQLTLGRNVFSLHAFKWTGKWEIKTFYHAYDPDEPKMSDAKSYHEMIWKTVVDFIKWFNEKK